MSSGAVVVISIAAIVAYALMGAAVSGLAKRICPHWHNNSVITSDPVPFVTGFAWPLTLVALTCVGLYRWAVHSREPRVACKPNSRWWR